MSRPSLRARASAGAIFVVSTGLITRVLPFNRRGLKSSARAAPIYPNRTGRR